MPSQLQPSHTAREVTAVTRTLFKCSRTNFNIESHHRQQKKKAEKCCTNHREALKQRNVLGTLGLHEKQSHRATTALPSLDFFGTYD